MTEAELLALLNTKTSLPLQDVHVIQQPAGVTWMARVWPGKDDEGNPAGVSFHGSFTVPGSMDDMSEDELNRHATDFVNALEAAVNTHEARTAG